MTPARVQEHGTLPGGDWGWGAVGARGKVVLPGTFEWKGPYACLIKIILIAWHEVTVCAQACHQVQCYCVIVPTQQQLLSIYSLSCSIMHGIYNS